MNNNFRVSFYLAGKSKAKKDGKRPILYRIHLGSERADMGATGYAVDDKKWDTKAGRINGTAGNDRFINKELETKEGDLRAIFRKFEFSDKLSLDLIRSEYLHQPEEDSETFLPYLDAYIEKRAEEVGHGLTPASLQKYKVTRRRFTEYLNEKVKRKDLLFTEIDHQLIAGFEHYLKTEVEMANNTAMRMLKTFKTVILEAISEGLITKDPYRGIKMHMDPVDRGFLTDEEIQALMSHDFDIKRLEQVRDVFVFSCFTGLAYIDVAQLKYENIVEMNGTKWIVTRRQKTSVSAHIPLLDVPLMLIEKYRGKASDNHVFPVMSNQKSNAYLKEIAAVCGITKNLTCHLARHTFATMSLTKGVPVESVSKMLGHTNIKTTQLYARITNKKVENDMKALAEKLTGFDGKMANMVEKEKKHSQVYNTPVQEETVVTRKPVDRPKRKPAGQPRSMNTPIGAARAAQTSPTELHDSVPAKKRGRPRKVQPAENSAPKTVGTTTAYIDGKLVAIKEPTSSEPKKRQRITHSVKVEIPAGRTARR